MTRACLIAVLALSACTTSPVENPREVWCEQNRPILLPAVAIAMLSRSDKEALASHNLRGEAWCGWR